MLIGTMATIWVTLSLEKIRLIERLDGIFMIFAVFTLCSLVVNKYRWVIGIYYLVNLAVLIFFGFYIQPIHGWTREQTISMIGDNIISLSFISFISFCVVSINNAALQRAEKSTKEAEKEVEKNIQLSSNLERTVDLRTLELSQKNEELKNEMEVRRKAEESLKELQSELVGNAHKAGMAEIAANTLHNVGNVLTSLNTSASLIKDAATKSPVENYTKANQILKNEWDSIDHFIANDPKCKALLEYYLKLEDSFIDSYKDIRENANRMLKKAEIISHIISSQQTYANSSLNIESIKIEKIIDDAMEILPDSFYSNGINIIKNFKANPTIYVQKSKFVHVVINLIANAEYAMKNNQPGSKNIWLDVETNDLSVFFKFRDSGCGISKEHLDQVFKHGFTTKKSGNGFGLHSCAIYLEDMKGSIRVNSEGEGKGAEFVITLPLKTSPPIQSDQAS